MEDTFVNRGLYLIAISTIYSKYLSGRWIILVIENTIFVLGTAHIQGGFLW